MFSLGLFVSLMPHSSLLFYLYTARGCEVVRFGFICVGCGLAMTVPKIDTTGCMQKDPEGIRVAPLLL